MKKIILCLCVLAAASNAFGIATVWTGDAGDGLWTTAGNWSLGLATLADTVKFQVAGEPDCVLDGPVVANWAVVGIDNDITPMTVTLVDGAFLQFNESGAGNFRVGQNGGVGILNIEGGTIDGKYVHFGHNTTGNIVNMTGGTIDLTTIFKLGNLASAGVTMTMSDGYITANIAMLGNAGTADFTMTGGLIELFSVDPEVLLDGVISIGAYGDVSLDGGIIEGSDLDMIGFAALDITGGTMILNNSVIDQTFMDRIEGYGITGYGSVANVDYDYDLVNGVTTITAVPEPATLFLLGLGGLALRKKRS